MSAHVHSCTAGQDSELKRSLMAKNKETFLGKWHATLQVRELPSMWAAAMSCNVWVQWQGSGP